MSNHSAAFTKAIQFILPHETEFVRGHWGDYSKEEYVRTERDPDDRGGTTRYGIDQRSHPEVDIESLTKEQAIEIYFTEWKKHSMDALPEKLAIAAFDVHVNGGHANRWLQHAYNICPSHGMLPFITEDGVLGPKSLAALCSGVCNEKDMVRIFIEQRDQRFQELAKNPRMAKYLKGWLNRDADLRTFLGV